MMMMPFHLLYLRWVQRLTFYRGYLDCHRGGSFAAAGVLVANVVMGTIGRHIRAPCPPCMVYHQSSLTYTLNQLQSNGNNIDVMTHTWYINTVSVLTAALMYHCRGLQNQSESFSWAQTLMESYTSLN